MQTTKVRELPKNFHTTIEVDDYEIMIITERKVTVTVTRKKSPGKLSHITIYNPGDLTIAEIYKKARETLEALVYEP
jgi:hypothetical protein